MFVFQITESSPFLFTVRVFFVKKWTCVTLALQIATDLENSPKFGLRFLSFLVSVRQCRRGEGLSVKFNLWPRFEYKERSICFVWKREKVSLNEYSTNKNLLLNLKEKIGKGFLLELPFWLTYSVSIYMHTYMYFTWLVFHSKFPNFCFIVHFPHIGRGLWDWHQ